MITNQIKISSALVLLFRSCVPVYIISSATSLILGKLFLTFFKQATRSKVRNDVPVTHQHKNYTPTMGGIFIITSALISWLILRLPFTQEVYLLYMCLTIFGLIGFYDDWCKIKKTQGISSRSKFLLQGFAAGLLVMYWLMTTSAQPLFSVPFIFSVVSIPLFVMWCIFLIVGTSNAVNLTDGLDGLATQSLIPNFAVTAWIAWMSSEASLAAWSLIMIGSLCGFLFYNCKPAQVFMGDVGSLPLGASLALIFLMLKHEWLLVLTGLIFVIETVSVILQIASLKLYKKRLFKMAPFHHHLELIGWSEQKIVFALSIATVALCIIALSLFIR